MRHHGCLYLSFFFLIQQMLTSHCYFSLFIWSDGERSKVVFLQEGREGEGRRKYYRKRGRTEKRKTGTKDSGGKRKMEDKENEN